MTIIISNIGLCRAGEIQRGKGRVYKFSAVVNDAHHKNGERVEIAEWHRRVTHRSVLE